MKHLFGLCILCCVLAILPGCTNTQKGALTGSAVGAAAGVGIAAVSGGYLGYGALAGAGAGALAGGFLGHNQDVEEERRAEERNRNAYYKKTHYRSHKGSHNRYDYYEDDDYGDYGE